MNALNNFLWKELANAFLTGTCDGVEDPGDIAVAIVVNRAQNECYEWPELDARQLDAVIDDLLDFHGHGRRKCVGCGRWSINKTNPIKFCNACRTQRNHIAAAL